ncbi:hypothetical protein C8Q76DRAFT_794677 [Earliella scabrosa]|nr:hypothetical protein C8Q76DRAFT_794677 [Earliella scabrosa]
MEDISAENAELVGLWLQLLATGAYLTYFWKCVVALKENRREGNTSGWLLGVCVLIFLCTISDQVLALIRTYQAFGVHEGRPPDPTAYYADPTTKLAIAKNTFNILMTLLFDIIIVYRTFVVWSFDVRVIVLPVCFLLANIALGVMSTVALAESRRGDVLSYATVSVRFRSYLILTFCLNALCAGLICWKIWRVNAMVSHLLSAESLTHHVLGIMVETAGIYCAYLLACIITNAAGTNVRFILLDPLPPFAAIIFSMMTVRGRPKKCGQSEEDTVSRSPTFRFWRSDTSGVSSRTIGSPADAGLEIDLERVAREDTRSSVPHDGDDLHGSLGRREKGRKMSSSTG